MKIKNKIQMFNEFGFRVAFSSACSSALRYPMALTRWKDRCIINWLKRNYSSVILKHKQTPIRQQERDDASSVIWSLWWQGEDNAPEIVKMCLSSIDRHRGRHPLKIITRDNFREYIDLPEHVMQKVDEGYITLTHLSDIIRFCLLYNYGGLWLDSTIFAAEDIPEEIFARDYYVIRHEKNPRSYGVNQDRWISFIQAAKKGSPLCGFGYDLLTEYWKERNHLIDYMLIDYAIETAYEEFPECTRLIDDVPLNNPEVDSLRPMLNDLWDSRTFERLRKSTSFFKLTYKHKLRKEIDGRETFYGHLLRQ